MRTGLVLNMATLYSSQEMDKGIAIRVVAHPLLLRLSNDRLIEPRRAMISEAVSTLEARILPFRVGSVNV